MPENKEPDYMWISGLGALPLRRDGRPWLVFQVAAACHGSVKAVDHACLLRRPLMEEYLLAVDKEAAKRGFEKMLDGYFEKLEYNGVLKDESES